MSSQDYNKSQVKDVCMSSCQLTGTILELTDLEVENEMQAGTKKSLLSGLGDSSVMSAEE